MRLQPLLSVHAASHCAGTRDTDAERVQLTANRVHVGPGIILPSRGSAFQFKVAVSGADLTNAPSVTWSSSSPAVVSVDQTGKATALADAGSATITAAAAGLPSQTASVIIATPGPHTVLIASTDVLSATDTNVTLVSNATTTALQPGDIIVSGDHGGLLHQVSAVRSAGSTIVMTTVPTSLAQAFRSMQVDVRGSVVQATMSLAHGRYTLTTHDGRKLAQGVLSGFTCTGVGGAAAAVVVSGPDVSVPVHAQLHVTYDENGFAVETFQLTAEITVPITVTTGSVTITGGANVSARCVVTLPQIDVPAVLPIGPIDVSGPVISQTFGIDVTGSAQQTIAVTGPTATTTVTATEGIQYLSGAWTTIQSNSVTANLTPGEATAQGSITAHLRPFYRADAGVAASTFFLPLGQANLAFVEGGSDFDLSINEPLDSGNPQYAGPMWSGGYDVSAGPELVVSPSTGVAKLMAKLGVSAPNVQWTAYQNAQRLVGSPTVDASVASSAGSTCGIDLTADIVDQNPVPLSYATDKVEFTTISGPMAPAVVASAPILTSSADATWNVSVPGPYAVRALLFDHAFGAVGLPYPSAPQSVAGPACPTARLVNVHFEANNAGSAEGTFQFDPLTLAIFNSTVTLKDPVWNVDTVLNDTAASGIFFFHDGTDFGIWDAQPCNDSSCTANGVILILDSMPRASGTYNLRCGPCGFGPFPQDSQANYDSPGHSTVASMITPGQLVVSFPPPAPRTQAAPRARRRN